jgi:hypothetical protein
MSWPASLANVRENQPRRSIRQHAQLVMAIAATATVSVAVAAYAVISNLARVETRQALISFYPGHARS